MRQGVLYGAGHSVGFGKSTDKGNTWTVYKTAQGLPSDVVYRIEFDALNRIYLGTAAGLAFTDNDGTTWTTKNVADGLPNAVANGISIEGSNVLAFYQYGGGGLAISRDRAQTFQLLDLTQVGLSTNVIGDAAIHNNVIYLSLDDGSFAMSFDFGQTWEKLTDPDAYALTPYNQITVYQGRLFLKSNSTLVELRD